MWKKSCTFASQLMNLILSMKAKRILFVTQEMMPYVPETKLSVWGRKLPQMAQEKGLEIRTFMPKWGIINERRNQLHEVIRLSGMNLVVDDTDHPLIIKVASIPSARIQIYFIDNDEFFTNQQMATDENGKEYDTNAERACFFAHGVLETVKKLRWMPDIIHCQGWMSSFIPLFVKTVYADEPSFCNCSTVYTPSHEDMCAPLPHNLNGILDFCGVPTAQALEGIESCNNMQILNHMGIKWADGTAFLTPNNALETLATQLGKTTLESKEENEWATTYPNFFDEVYSAR